MTFISTVDVEVAALVGDVDDDVDVVPRGVVVARGVRIDVAQRGVGRAAFRFFNLSPQPRNDSISNSTGG